MKSLFLFFILFLTVSISAQEFSSNLSESKNLISELTSEKFAGRGYVENGMWKSAEFIAGEFQKIGLKKIGDSYFQEFTMPINIIENAELEINNQVLKYGIDFIVKPNSKPINFQNNENYIFSPADFQNALKSDSVLVKFIERDMVSQNARNVVFPPHHFEIDSLNQYYKNWASFYRPEENRNRAVLFFTNEKLTSSLSQTQDSISEFFVAGKYFSNDLEINNYQIESNFKPDFKARNVIGKIEGKNKDSLIVVTAHYDHLGKIGNVYFPGASDNASGTVFMLELAKYFSEHKPKYSMVFIAFAAEEAGLLGSAYFVENPVFDLSKIKFLLNFDIMGAGEDGIQIVNSSVFTKEFALLNQINSEKNYVKQIKKRGEACNSDHCPFYEKAVPSFFTYTLGGPGFYHDIFDKGESLNLAEFEDLQKLFIEFIEKL
jgi:hypothetical protein